MHHTCADLPPKVVLALSCIPTQMHTHTHTHRHTHAHTCIRLYMHTNTHTPMHAHTIAHTYTQHMDHPTHTLRVCASAWWASIIVTLFSSGWTFNTTLPRQSVQPWLPFFASSTRQSSPTATSNISIHSATACSTTSSPQLSFWTRSSSSTYS